MIVCVILFVVSIAPAPTEIYPYCNTLSLHDALPISRRAGQRAARARLAAGAAPLPARHRAGHDDHRLGAGGAGGARAAVPGHRHRSEEHTSELQSLMRHSYAVFCFEKKNNSTTWWKNVQEKL